MDRVLETLRPHLERLAKPYADPAHPAESATDLLQESCLRAWQKIGTFEGGKNDEETFKMFRAWVGQIVKHLGLDGKRDQGRKRRKPSGEVFRLGSRRPGDSTGLAARAEAEARGPGPSTIARNSELARRIEKALEGTPDKTGAAIVRSYFFDGQTFVEIAEHLGLPYNQVRDHFSAVLKRLKVDLKDWL